MLKYDEMDLFFLGRLVASAACCSIIISPVVIMSVIGKDCKWAPGNQTLYYAKNNSFEKVNYFKTICRQIYEGDMTFSPCPKNINKKTQQ